MSEPSLGDKVIIFLQGLEEQHSLMIGFSEEVKRMLAEQMESCSTAYKEHLERLDKSADERVAEAKAQAYELHKENEKLRSKLEEKTKELRSLYVAGYTSSVRASRPKTGKTSERKKKPSTRSTTGMLPGLSSLLP